MSENHNQNEYQEYNEAYSNNGEDEITPCIKCEKVPDEFIALRCGHNFCLLCLAYSYLYFINSIEFDEPVETVALPCEICGQATELDGRSIEALENVLQQIIQQNQQNEQENENDQENEMDADEQFLQYDEYYQNNISQGSVKHLKQEDLFEQDDHHNNYNEQYQQQNQANRLYINDIIQEDSEEAFGTEDFRTEAMMSKGSEQFKLSQKGLFKEKHLMTQSFPRNNQKLEIFQEQNGDDEEEQNQFSQSGRFSSEQQKKQELQQEYQKQQERIQIQRQNEDEYLYEQEIIMKERENRYQQDKKLQQEKLQKDRELQQQQEKIYKQQQLQQEKIQREILLQQEKQQQERDYHLQQEKIQKEYLLQQEKIQKEREFQLQQEKLQKEREIQQQQEKLQKEREFQLQQEKLQKEREIQQQQEKLQKEKEYQLQQEKKAREFQLQQEKIQKELQIQKDQEYQEKLKKEREYQQQQEKLKQEQLQQQKKLQLEQQQLQMEKQQLYQKKINEKIKYKQEQFKEFIARFQYQKNIVQQRVQEKQQLISQLFQDFMNILQSKENQLCNFYEHQQELECLDNIIQQIQDMYNNAQKYLDDEEWKNKFIQEREQFESGEINFDIKNLQNQFQTLKQEVSKLGQANKSVNYVSKQLIDSDIQVNQQSDDEKFVEKKNKIKVEDLQQRLEKMSHQSKKVETQELRLERLTQKLNGVMPLSHANELKHNNSNSFEKEEFKTKVALDNNSYYKEDDNIQQLWNKINSQKNNQSKFTFENKQNLWDQFNKKQNENIFDQKIQQVLQLKHAPNTFSNAFQDRIMNARAFKDEEKKEDKKDKFFEDRIVEHNRTPKSQSFLNNLENQLFSKKDNLGFYIKEDGQKKSFLTKYESTSNLFSKNQTFTNFTKNDSSINLYLKQESNSNSSFDRGHKNLSNKFSFIQEDKHYNFNYKQPVFKKLDIQRNQYERKKNLF